MKQGDCIGQICDDSDRDSITSYEVVVTDIDSEDGLHEIALNEGAQGR